LIDDTAVDKTDFIIENLKNQISQLQNKARAQRDVISNLRGKIAILNKKLKMKK